MERDIESLKNTHLMMWLKDGWNHCRRGSQDWCQGYLNSAHDYIEALERENAALRSELDDARKALEPFANYKTADGLADGFLRIPDEHPVLFNGLGSARSGVVTVGDFRRAAAIRQKGEQP